MRAAKIEGREFEAGQIRIGRKGDEIRDGDKVYRLPQKVDGFLLCEVERNERGNQVLCEDLMATVGGEAWTDRGEPPKCLAVYLAGDTVEECFHTYRAHYDRSKVAVCRQVEELRAERVLEGGELALVDCPCDDADRTAGAGCDVHGVLNCVLAARPEFGAVWKFRPNGYLTVQAILGALERLYALGGSLAGLPVTLRHHWRRVEAASGEWHNVPVVTLTFDGNPGVLTMRQTMDDCLRRGTKSCEEIEADQGAPLDGALDPADSSDEEPPEIPDKPIDDEPPASAKATAGRPTDEAPSAPLDTARDNTAGRLWAQIEEFLSHCPESSRNELFEKASATEHNKGWRFVKAARSRVRDVERLAAILEKLKTLDDIPFGN